MTNEEILDTFETFVDDSLDSAVAIALAEQARINIEIELRLQCSKKLDTSKTVSSGSTYLTAYTLPTDVLVPASPYIYVGTDRYTMIPFEQRELYKDITGYWYVDLLNGNFYLTGTPTAGQTITLPYITSGTAIADDDTTVLKWPTGTHILIPMKMAQLWYAIDGGDKSRAWDDRWGVAYAVSKNSLIDWDAQWKHAAVGGVTPYGEEDSYNPNAINSLSS